MIADSAEIKFACSQCGQSLLVDSSGAGLSLNCPTCDHPMIVPTPGSFHSRNYGEGAPVDKSRAGLSTETDSTAAAEAQELREELVEALRRADDFERALNSARKETTRLQQQLKKATEDHERLTANATAAQAEARTFQTERQQWKTDLAQARQSAATAESQLSDARLKISHIEANLTALEENRAQWEQAFSQTAAGAEASESQLAALVAELEQVRAQAMARDEALRAARGEAEALRGERTTLGRELETTQAGLRDAESVRVTLAATEEKLTAANRATTTAEEERQSMAGRCAALRQEVDGLRYSLSNLKEGRELLDLRNRVKTLEAEHQSATTTVARLESETRVLNASEKKVRAELEEARTRGDEAERRAEAASESVLVQDNEVLRGIIARQNTVLEERFVELRKLKRARLFLRILYTFVGLGLVGVAALAVEYLPETVRQWINEWLPNF
jgi:chromosome segregation ATPase